MQELISIVIPVYNCAPYLDACLQSLQAQTWQNWETVLVDDGSRDGSAELCDAWAAKDPRIQVLHQKNAGVSAARNAGIEAAHGAYLAFVDGDDRVEPEYLEVLYRTLGHTQMAVCCVYDLSDWNEKVREELVPLDIFRASPSRYANPVYTNYPCNKLFLTRLIRDNRIVFPVGVRRCEDAYFVQDYLLCCQAISVCTRKLYHYDQHEGSAMHRFYAGVCDDEIPLMQRQYELFHSSGPHSLEKSEEDAFQCWQYGKILGILRYILQYAPDRTTALAQTQRLMDVPLVRRSMLAPPPGTGKKARLAAWLLRAKAWPPLLKLLATM